MNEALLHQDIGSLKAQVVSMEREIGDLKTAITAANKANAEALAEIRTTLSEARGGWRALVVVGGIAGAIVGLLTRFLPDLGGG